MIVVHDTTSELESRDLVDPVICRCRKHRQLACQVWGFVVCFPLDVPTVHLSKPTIVTDSNNMTGVRISGGEIIRFGILEFITDHFHSLNFSPEGNDSGTVFVGMVHSGSPSLYAIVDESASEDDSASSDWGSSGFPLSRGCNVLTLTIPITRIH
jgi:hypothetical protein